MSDAPLRIAIIGTGFLARTRVRCWKRVFGARMEVMSAARDRAKAEAFAREHGVACAGTIDEALDDRSIRLVDLCVANRAHRELCVRAAACGKDVLCTKPLAAYWGQGLDANASAEEVAAVERATMFAGAVEDASAMVEACRAAGTRLFYGENWCFAPSIARAAALTAAANTSILEMRGWESHSGSHSTYARDWRHSGGGALLRLGAHPIGAMLWLKRLEGVRTRGRAHTVVSVNAETMTRGDASVESWGSCTLTFDDGSVAVALGSDHMLGGMESHLTVLAQNHRVECALSPNTQLRTYAPQAGTFLGEYIMEKVDSDAGWSTPMPDEDWSSGHQWLVQSVADALSNDSATTCDGELGLDVVRVIYAAYQSAHEGRRIAL